MEEGEVEDKRVHGVEDEFSYGLLCHIYISVLQSNIKSGEGVCTVISFI
jgi:hypothetical protein